MKVRGFSHSGQIFFFFFLVVGGFGGVGEGECGTYLSRSTQETTAKIALEVVVRSVSSQGSIRILSKPLATS